MEIGMRPQTSLKFFAWILSASLISPALALEVRPAQIGEGPLPHARLLSGRQSQKPEPVPSRKPVPLPDQEPEQRPAPQEPPAGQQGDSQKSATRTFTGTITKAGRKYVLKASDKVTYDLDDQTRVQRYQGKHVEVIGSLEESSQMIHVEEIKEAS
jgi:hypothetical protein